MWPWRGRTMRLFCFLRNLLPPIGTVDLFMIHGGGVRPDAKMSYQKDGRSIFKGPGGTNLLGN
ncbi:hypothetical protein GBA52_008695 [Prunus armeniaca]|nr:hypothetical protein GBA52_008695 [Prunus armeniaca]